MNIKPNSSHFSHECFLFQAPKARKSILFYVSVLLFVFMLKSIVLMRGGALYGRLSVPPPYDDVYYFVDALERMRIFLDQGLYGFMQNLVNTPPHAPYSTLSAMLAFLFGGPYVAGPYLMNGVAMALLSAMVFVLFRISALTAWCIAVIVIVTQWFDNAVTIFHPDLIAGFAIAIMTAVLIWQNEVIRTRTQAVAIGAAAGLVLLIKPVAFGLAIGVWGLAFLIGAAIAYREEKSLWHIAMRLMFAGLPLLAIATPYFAHELGGIIDYIYAGFVSQSAIWAQHVTESQDAFYYLDQAQESFENWMPIAGGGALAIVATAALGRDWTTALRFAGLILTTLMAYLIPASVDVKRYLFGGVFYGSVAVCLILAIHFLVDRLNLIRFLDRSARFQPVLPGAGPVMTAVLVLIGAGALAGLADRQVRQNSNPYFLGSVQAEYDGVYGVLRDIYRRWQIYRNTSATALEVYFPCPAPVAPHAYRFRGLVDGIDISLPSAANAVALNTQVTLQEVLDEADKAAVIVVPGEDSLKWIYPYPVNKLLLPFRTWLAQNARFTHVRTIHTDLGSADIFVDTSVAHDAVLPSEVH